ncbi:MAG: DUF1565 domain-containing protein [Treponema sp.]|nr:DUF1565 domain-containing protein [Treponema sp.]
MRGSDNSDGSVEKPFRTIQNAVDLAQAGDAVFIRSGTYAERVIITNSGADGKPITIAAFPSETPPLLIIFVSRATRRRLP